MAAEPGQRRLVIGLSVALTAALVAVLLLWLDREPRVDAAARDDSADAAALLAAGADAEVAARAAVERMTTYTHLTVEDDFTWVDEAGTEKFQTYFEAASSDAVEVIRSLEASATGTVIDAAPSVVDATHVKVLLFVDQEISSRTTDDAKLDQPRVSMQMVLQDGRWLVDEVAVNDLLNQ